MQGSAVNADLSGPLLGIRRPGKLIPMAKWSKEAKAQRKRMVAAVGERVAGKSYRQEVEGGERGLPGRLVCQTARFSLHHLRIMIGADLINHS